jgi:signal peptide peptidase SppA, 67K type
MKQFFKFTLAAIVGMLVVSIINFMLFFGIIGAMVSSSEKVTVLKPNSVYELNLSGELADRSEDPFSAILQQAMGNQSYQSLGLNDVLANIEKAKNDDKIAGIYLKGGTLSGGIASLKEIRDALVDFKTSGKFIVAYADMYSQSNYFLASVADKICVNPQGTVDFQGLASQTPFFKNMLEKIGLEMQIVKVGTYKSAVEPYIETSMSDANREQVTKYVGSIWNNMLEQISSARQIPVTQLNIYADEMLGLQPVELALNYQLIDSLVYVDEMDSIINAYAADYKTVKHSELLTVTSKKKNNRNRIAVVYAVGDIDGSDSNNGIVSEKLVKTLDKVAKDDKIKAVVLRVNSPGGSAYGSEQIWRAVGNLKSKKPVIVSMGNYAASGGYYIACIADTIVAQPNTLTGSIGIFGMIPNAEGLTKKIGVNFDGVKTNKMSDGITLLRRFTADERDLLQKYVNSGYETFVTRCADGRGMTTDAIKEIAEGRVWTGEDALKLGLVDVLGGLSDAINIAAAKAEIENYQVKEYPEPENFMTTLLGGVDTKMENKMLKKQLGEYYNVFQQIKNIESMCGTIQARMPYDIVIK